STTRRCRPERSRRVCTSCWPIERRICSAWAWLKPPAAGTGRAGWQRAELPAPAPGGRWAVAGAAAATAPRGQLEVPFRREVTGVEQQGFAIGALGLGQVPVAVHTVSDGDPQRQEAEVVQRAKPDIGLERRAGTRQRLLRGLQVSPCQRGGAGVVPGGVVLAMARK